MKNDNFELIVGVNLYDDNGDLSKTIYDFKNKYNIPVKENDTVIVKIGTGGTTTGVVKYVRKLPKEDLKGFQYKNILEVENLQINQDTLLEGNKYVCDIRIWREQWETNSRCKEYGWSDLLITCLYDIDDKIKIGCIVSYKDTEGKVVNLRQIPINKTLKLDIVKIKPIKMSLFRKLFNNIIK